MSTYMFNNIDVMLLTKLHRGNPKSIKEHIPEKKHTLSSDVIDMKRLYANASLPFKYLSKVAAMDTAREHIEVFLFNEYLSDSKKETVAIIWSNVKKIGFACVLVPVVRDVKTGGVIFVVNEKPSPYSDINRIDLTHEYTEYSRSVYDRAILCQIIHTHQLFKNRECEMLERERKQQIIDHTNGLFQ